MNPMLSKKISILMKTSGFVMQYFVFFYMFLYLECNYLCFTPPPLSTVFVMFNKINYFSGVAQGINFLYRKGEEREKLIYLFKINNICRGKKLELMVLKEMSFCHTLKFSNPLFISLKPDGVNL